MTTHSFVWTTALAALGAILNSCGSSSGGAGPAPQQTGAACTSPAQCYPAIDAAALVGGSAQCLPKVTGGYCTHTGSTDADCCAVPGECADRVAYVCSSFESMPDKY